MLAALSPSRACWRRRTGRLLGWNQLGCRIAGLASAMPVSSARQGRIARRCSTRVCLSRAAAGHLRARLLRYCSLYDQRPLSRPWGGRCRGLPAARCRGACCAVALGSSRLCRGIRGRRRRLLVFLLGERFVGWRTLGRCLERWLRRRVK